MPNQKLDTFGTTILMALAFLLPLLFIPWPFASFTDTKFFLLILGVTIAGLLWTFARLKSNEMHIPKTYLVIPMVLFPLLAAITGLFSGNIRNSFLGQSFSLDTVLTSFLLSVLFFLGIFLFNTKDKVVKLYLLILASWLIFFIYQLVRLFLGFDVLSFDLFFGSTGNLLGKWNDVAIFAGVITLMATLTISVLRPYGLLSWLSYAGLVSSLFLLVVVNFQVVWIVLAAISFLLLAQAFFKARFAEVIQQKEEGEEKERVPGLVLCVFAISVLFVFAGNLFEGYISSYLGIAQLEARPSVQATTLIVKDVYSTNPFLGIGPNNFTKEWLTHKPSGVNQSPFWDTDFSFGVGIIPTFFITQGVLSVLLWLTFFGLFVWLGIRTFANVRQKVFDNYLGMTSFLAALFLWVLSIFYVPGVVLFALTFLISGVFVATQINTGAVKKIHVVFSENIRTGFISVVLLFLLLATLLSSLYIGVTKFGASIYTTQAQIVARDSGDFDTAQKHISQALLFSEGDYIYRAASNISMLRLSDIVSRGSEAENAQQEFQTTLSNALDSARQALRLDAENYQNWLTLARVYEGLIPLGIEGAYSNAKIGYERALEYNTNNPRLHTNIARVEALQGNNETARERITSALQAKNDYTPALFLLSEIEVREGRVSDAISSVESASLLAPSDPTVFFQLGILKYSENDFTGAIRALERAVFLDNQYSNARYFLGLSYYEERRGDDALEQFEFIQTLNPDNEEIELIIQNLIAGRAPLENFTPPTSATGGNLPF